MTDSCNLAELRENLASVQHEIWAHWMTYLLRICYQNTDGSRTIPADQVRRWKRQISSSYIELPPSEQESDLEQADKILDLLKEHCSVGDR